MQQQQQQLCVERTYSTRRNDLQQQQFGTDEKIPTPVAFYKIQLKGEELLSLFLHFSFA